MHQRAARLRRHVRHTNQVKNGEMLGICAGDGIDRTQSAYSIGCTDCANAMNACIALGRVRSVKLSATSDPLYFRKVYDGIFYGKSVVSRNSEDFGYSNGL